MMKKLFTLLLAASSLTAFGQYEVGDVGPAGGWIFYVDSLDEFDWDFLEVADRAIASTRQMNGNSNVSVDGQGLPAELGTGRSNSQNLIADNSAPPQFSAIIQALGCELGGYSDWYMPSFGEMHLVYENVLDLIDEDGDLGNLTADWVWTSSSVWSDVGLIDLMHLTSGDPLSVTANGTNSDFDIRVIPIRSGNFPSEEFCGSGTIWDPTSQTCIVDESACSWQPDSDGDQLIGVSDLLMFLSVFGDTDLDQDGIFDSNDDCVGEYDECGVCNGSGPSIPIIESIEILYDSLYAEQIDEWWVFEVGTDTTYSLICGYGCTDLEAENYDSSADTDDGSCIYPWACGDPLEYQGYDYETVQIGEQCWFAENLRVTQYRNGDDIPTLDNAAWPVAQSGAQAVYGENYGSSSSWCSYTGLGATSATNGDACDEIWSLEEYGRLYNFFAVYDDRLLCPAGWGIPTDLSWSHLIDFLGGSEIAADDLKSPVGWTGSGNGTNGSGFDGRPGGSRHGTGAYYHAGSYGHWWSSSFDGQIALAVVLSATDDEVSTVGSFPKSGFSVRCIKD